MELVKTIQSFKLIVDPKFGYLKTKKKQVPWWVIIVSQINYTA